MRIHGNAIYIKPVRYLLTHHFRQTLSALGVVNSVKAARKYLGMFTNPQLQHLCNLLDSQKSLQANLNSKLKQAKESS